LAPFIKFLAFFRSGFLIHFLAFLWLFLAWLCPRGFPAPYSWWVRSISPPGKWWLVTSIPLEASYVFVVADGLKTSRPPCCRSCSRYDEFRPLVVPSSGISWPLSFMGPMCSIGSGYGSRNGLRLRYFCGSGLVMVPGMGPIVPGSRHRLWFRPPGCIYDFRHLDASHWFGFHLDAFMISGTWMQVIGSGST
jgi:hypothetical protein